MQFCPYCGKEIPNNVEYCPFCGAKISENKPYSPIPKKRDDIKNSKEHIPTEIETQEKETNLKSAEINSDKSDGKIIKKIVIFIISISIIASLIYVYINYKDELLSIFKSTQNRGSSTAQNSNQVIKQINYKNEGLQQNHKTATLMDKQKLLSQQNSKVGQSNYPYVCYSKKYIVNNSVVYSGCIRSAYRCSSIGKYHFGKYPNDYKAHQAFKRCLSSNPKFIDRQGL